MPESKKPGSTDEKRFNETLKRMLKTPHKPREKDDSKGKRKQKKKGYTPSAYGI